MISKLRVAFLSSAVTATILVLAGNFFSGERRVKVQLGASPAFAAWNVAGTHSVADVAEKAMPSVVNISSSRKVKAQRSPFEDNPFFREFFGQQEAPEYLQRGLGSGVIISPDGIVVTNNHVIAKADEIKVTGSDNREWEAQVIGTDPKSDLAVIKLKGAKNLAPIALGDSSTLRLGDLVLAVGNPFGVGQTVTMGIISAKGRGNIGIVDYEDFLQTDAAINPGNSGGALVNMRGELIGINTAILSRSGGYQGIGFAIPTSMARPIIESLKKTGKVVRGYLGVMIQDADSELAKALNLPTTHGVLVSDVVSHGPADRAGLKRGDFITSVDGHVLATAAELRNYVASAGSSKGVRVEFLRGGQKKQVDVKLGELPAEATRSGVAERHREQTPAGLELAPLNNLTRERFEIPSSIGYGVVVVGVQPGGQAAAADLHPGDVILELNRAKIDGMERFRQLYSAASKRTLLLVARQGSTFYVVLNK